MSFLKVKNAENWQKTPENVSPHFVYYQEEWGQMIPVCWILKPSLHCNILLFNLF